MDIRVLKYFVAAAQSRSISAASKALFITQPTLTRQFHELEEELGQTLFTRSKHGIELTAQGELFYERAMEVLNLIAKVEAEVKGAGAIVGTLSIVAAEVPAMQLIAQAFKRLADAHPQVDLELFTATRCDALAKLETGSFDFALLVRAVDTRRYNVLTLTPGSEWGLLVKDDHPLAQRSTISPEDLKGQPLIMPRSEMDDRSFEGWLGYSLLELKIKAIHNLSNNGCAFVAAGLGAMVTLERDGTVMPYPCGLKFIPLEPKFVSHPVLVWKKERRLTPCAALFLQEVRAALKTA